MADNRLRYTKWIYLLIISAVAIFLRYWFIMHIPSEPVFDFSTYQEIASNIYHHLGHTLMGQPVAWQGMAYPTILGWFYILMGNDQVHTARLFNLGLSLLSLPLILLIFKKLSSNKVVVYGAYTLTIFLPNYIAYTNVVGTEVFFLFLFLLILVLQLYNFKNWLRYPLLGIVIGIAALTKPFFLAYPLVVGLHIWMKNRNWKETAVMLLTISVVMATVVFPWTLRNYRCYNAFIPISYNSGYVLFINNNSNNVNGSWMPLEEVPASPSIQRQIETQLQKNQDNVKLAAHLEKTIKPVARKWIIDHPGAFMELGLLRLKQTFFSGAWDIDAWAMNGIFMVGQDSPEFRRHINTFYAGADILIYILSSAGIIYLLLNTRRLLKALFSRKMTLKDEVLIPCLNTAFFLAVYFVFEGQARYNYPLLFLFAISLFIIMHKTSDGLRSE